VGRAKQKLARRHAHFSPLWCWLCSRWMGKVGEDRWWAVLRCPKCGAEKRIALEAYKEAT
jgi:hypothetical protein